MAGAVLKPLFNLRFCYFLGIHSVNVSVWSAYIPIILFGINYLRFYKILMKLLCKA